MERSLLLLHITATKAGNLKVENPFYTLELDRSRGGVIKRLVAKGASSRNVVHREGCEIWPKAWGPFHPNHYQQEFGGFPKFEYARDSSSIKVKVSSKMGMHDNPKRKRGWCRNTWYFQGDTPLILCNARIGGAHAPETMFKKYICFPRGLFSKYAYRRMCYVKTGPITTLPAISPPPKWISVYNQHQGLAMICARVTPKNCDICFAEIWQSKVMTEILYACSCKSRTLRFSLGYLPYLTTAQDEWKPIDQPV